MTECQARKRALESVDQFQKHRMADSKRLPIIKPLRFLKIPEMQAGQS